ncbi:tetratricopeptide repeat protein [Sphingosinicella terrae]|uniref:tetratricopeptide repeat protein n=1 Tax=Sphingosinicella terrae TaxID=2172047 RepID=UPI0013B36C30|nr:tetratricopeptide repeat protein [Sphingosinicella terrae]
MKRIALIAFGAAALAMGTSAYAQTMEEGFPAGSLAVAAIERGDWATAERLLEEDRGLARDNPARLVNLGRVYMATGRTGQALAVWRDAMADRHPEEIVTAGGRVTTTDRLAREAIAHYEQALASAAR